VHWIFRAFNDQLLINRGVGEFLNKTHVIPAKAGIQIRWDVPLDARLRGHDGKNSPMPELIRWFRDCFITPEGYIVLRSAATLMRLLAFVLDQ
jgi:hypothetical protein